MTSSAYKFSFKIFRGFTPYLTQDAKEKLKQYKYSGGDNGIFYKLFYNPLALKLVQYLPETIAPNLITFIGFLFTVIPFIILFALFGTDFTGYVAPWWCFLEGISYLIYRILDEMDGKQARKTGNSSPLGLLFDHGCDSLTAALFTIMIIKTIQVGNNMYALLALGSVAASFHFCTLEEYYVGGLFLGLGNGVTDGSVILIAIFIIQGITQQGFFNYTVDIPWGDGKDLTITLTQILMYITIISQLLACLYNFYCIIRDQYKEKTQEQKAQSEPVNYGLLIQQILAFYIVFFLICYAATLQETPIIESYPLLPALLFSFVYSHNTIHIQVSHVSKQKYIPWTRTLIFNILSLTLYITIQTLFKKTINGYIFFGVMVGLTFLAQWHYIICIIDEMTKTLGIAIFKTKQQLKAQEPLLLDSSSSQQSQRSSKKSKNSKKKNKIIQKSESTHEMQKLNSK